MRGIDQMEETFWSITERFLVEIFGHKKQETSDLTQKARDKFAKNEFIYHEDELSLAYLISKSEEDRVQRNKTLADLDQKTIDYSNKILEEEWGVGR